ncbi:hypothetical protein T484DRAFT_1760379 [Baffinella frigidus]|nr:hypothetical protein T484DRAFT_1760379 [Cryptophyta sp. CCMP2293]
MRARSLEPTPSPPKQEATNTEEATVRASSLEAAQSPPPNQEPPNREPAVGRASSLRRPNSFRRMFSLGASFISKGIARAETPTPPMPGSPVSSESGSTIPALHLTRPASAGNTPKNSSFAWVPEVVEVSGMRTPVAEFQEAEERQERGTRNPTFEDTVTRELRREFILFERNKVAAFSSHKCATCGQGYSSAGSLALHERAHRGEQPYRCPLCGEAFSTAGQLHRHSVSERNSRPQPASEGSMYRDRSEERNTGPPPESEGGSPLKQSGERGAEKDLLESQQKSVTRFTPVLKKTSSFRRTSSGSR